MMFRQLFAIALGLCFVVLAALQYSRPDAVLWISVYLIAAIFSFMAALEKISRALLLLACLAYASGAFYFWPNQQEAIPAAYGFYSPVGEPYESLYLAFAGAAMLLFIAFNKKKMRLHPPHAPGRLKRWAN